MNEEEKELKKINEEIHLIEDENKELKDDKARKALQKVYLYGLFLFPISVVLFCVLYNPMVALAIIINGNGGAFWGALYYSYSIAGYFCFIIIIIQIQYMKFYEVKKNQTKKVLKDTYGYRYKFKTVSANPTIFRFLSGLIMLVCVFIFWGLGAVFIGTLIPTVGPDNFPFWVVYNVSNLGIFLGWSLLVFWFYLKDLKYNHLTTN